MYAVSTPVSRGIGTSSFESLPKHPFAISRLEPEAYPVDRVRVDDVRLSSQASASGWTGPIDAAAFDLPDESGLLAAARSAHDFLADHPRLSGSAFGKSAALLVRATLQLERNGNLDALPQDGQARIARAAANAQSFLADHPRVADSPLGVSVAKMAQAVAAAIRTDEGGNQTQLADWLMAAAKRAELYLDEYPALASMPLGEVVLKLVDGVKALADGNPLDADLQTLAKRVGYFLQNHPRLAQSEFGQLIAPVGRGIAAIDLSAVPNAEPPADGTRAPAAEAAVVLDVMPGKAGIADEGTAARLAA